MTPLERAGKAAYDGFNALPGLRVHPDGPHFDWADLTPESKAPYVGIARAVLTAIRESSEGMVEEGASVIPCGQGVEEGPPNLSDARDCWREMIDAALAEG